MDAEALCFAVAYTLVILGVLIILIIDVINERKNKKR